MNMKKMTGLILFFCGHIAFSGTPSDRLQAKLNALRTMSADFSQTVKVQHRAVSHATGVMALARPGRFRWQTKEPLQQIVVADGKRLWIYDVELEQVSVKKQESSVDGTAGLFLSGTPDTVARDFNVVLAEKGSIESFDLTAKSNKANFQRMKLVFDGPALRGIAMLDQLGQWTDVQLNHIRVNPKLATSLFQFKPPRGVDVIDQ